MRYQTRKKRIDYKSKHINEISNLQTSILKNLIGKNIQGVIWLWEFHLECHAYTIAAAIGKILWYDNRNANQVLIGLIIGNHKDKIARNENRVL
jgi:hypothetical protein